MSDVLSWIRLAGPFLIGHRGFPGAARENTSPSFEAALEAGCDGVELDVRMTRDGVLVVHHDEVLPLGVGSVGGLSWEELSGLRLGEEGYRVERLSEVLGALSGRCLINVEVKPPGAGRWEAVAVELDRELEKVRPRESVLVSSFDLEMLAAVRAVSAEVFLGYLFTSMGEFNHLEEAEVEGALTSVHPHHSLVDRRFMKRAEERGVQVHAWTVDEVEEVRKLVALGVTSVITNRPDVCGEGVLGDAK